jgi:hypothetical protein
VNELAYFDIQPILAKLSGIGREFVLVGGQAVNFWAARYEHRVPELAREAPFTSKDVDFCGGRYAVRLCAERLGGKARLPSLDDVATPNTGIVEFVDSKGVTRTLDVVSAPFGLKSTEVHETALSAEIVDEKNQPIGATFFVMHPVLCMESRVHNVIGLPDYYNNEQGRKQLRASILSAREFLRDVIEGRMDAENPVRDVLKLNERIFRFCMQDSHATTLYRKGGVDPATSLLAHDLLPEMFRSRRWPQMQDRLGSRTLDPR